MNLELPPQDIGTAMKPQQMVDQLEEHIVGQVGMMTSDSLREVFTLYLLLIYYSTK